MKSHLEINEFGDKRYKNKAGELHNENGPAVEFPDGFKSYYINGKRHREDGPSVIFQDGFKLYYINGRELTPEQFKKHKKYKLKKRLMELIK